MITLNNKIINALIFISAAMLVAGLFLPLASLPLYGDLSYYRISPFESYIVIAFAVLAPLLVLFNKPKLLMLAPIGIWLTLFFPAIEGYLKPAKESFLGKVSDKMASSMQDVVLDLFLNILELGLGAYLFIAGLVLFTIFSALRSFK